MAISRKHHRLQDILFHVYKLVLQAFSTCRAYSVDAHTIPEELAKAQDTVAFTSAEGIMDLSMTIEDIVAHRIRPCLEKQAEARPC